MGYDAKQIVNQGNSFFIAAKRCLELRPLEKNKFELPIAPAVVCAAFAIELYFKAIITVEHGAAKGHDLAVLFSYLSPKSQVALQKELSLEEVDFKKNLDSVSHAFVEWRYIFESQWAKVETAFIINLADASKKLAETLISTIP